MALTKRAIWASTEDERTLPQRRYGWEMLKSHWGHPDFERRTQGVQRKTAAQLESGPQRTPEVSTV